MKYFLLILIFSITARAALIPNHEQQIQITIGQMMKQMISQDNNIITQIMNTIFNDKCSAQELLANPDCTSVPACTVFSDLGSNAAILRTGRANISTLASVIGGAITASEPAGYTITNNQDGTVTCVAPTPSPSPSP